MKSCYAQCSNNNSRCKWGCYCNKGCRDKCSARVRSCVDAATAKYSFPKLPQKHRQCHSKFRGATNKCFRTCCDNKAPPKTPAPQKAPTPHKPAIKPTSHPTGAPTPTPCPRVVVTWTNFGPLSADGVRSVVSGTIGQDQVVALVKTDQTETRFTDFDDSYDAGAWDPQLTNVTYVQTDAANTWEYGFTAPVSEVYLYTSDLQDTTLTFLDTGGQPITAAVQSGVDFIAGPGANVITIPDVVWQNGAIRLSGKISGFSVTLSRESSTESFPVAITGIPTNC